MFAFITITMPFGMTYAQFERAARREFWIAMMRETNGNVRHAAYMAGCPRTTTLDRLRRLDIRPQDFTQ